MSITRADVGKIAELARLALSHDETDLFTEQLSSIIKHVEKLNELETTAAESISHCTRVGSETDNATREDQVSGSLGQKVAVENAPDSEAGYFRVPRVIGG